MGSLSPLEALRAIAIAIGLWAATWGHRHAPDGRMAFPRPIREGMITRRREQMVTYLRVMVALVVGVVTAGLTENVYPMTFATLITNVVYLYVTVEITILILRQTMGWVEFERIVGSSPLVPSADEITSQTSFEARDILHEAHNRTTEVVLKVDELRLRDDVPMVVLFALHEVQTALLDISTLQHAAHVLVRSQTAQNPTKEDAGNAV